MCRKYEHATTLDISCSIGTNQDDKVKVSKGSIEWKTGQLYRMPHLHLHLRVQSHDCTADHDGTRWKPSRRSTMFQSVVRQQCAVDHLMASRRNFILRVVAQLAQVERIDRWSLARLARCSLIPTLVPSAN